MVRVEVPNGLCPSCHAEMVGDEKCARCSRPPVQDVDYVDTLETLAWAVVNAAYDEFGGDFRQSTGGGSALKRSIVQLADELKHWHYKGDGCLEED